MGEVDICFGGIHIGMGMFGEYCRCRDMQEEGLWMPDDAAVIGLSRMKPPQPPKPLKPLKTAMAAPQPSRPFRPKPPQAKAV
jgi:hypothetical protein